MDTNRKTTSTSASSMSLIAASAKTISNHRTPIRSRSRNVDISSNNENNVDLNTSHYPSVAEAISNFQNIILEAERELSNSSLKDRQSESIRSFETKLGLPRFNSSKIMRRKSVNVRYSKGRIETSAHNDHTNQSRSNLHSTSKSSIGRSNVDSKYSSNHNSHIVRPSADSDDEKSKKKIMSSSICEKRAKLNKQLDLNNANEHFTNLLRVRNEDTLIKLVKMHLLMLLDLDGENFSNVFEDHFMGAKKTNTMKKKKQDTKSHDKTGGLFQQVLTEEGICRLYLLTDFIGRPKNINQEGVFRKCGSATRQQELKYRLQNNIPLELESDKYNVHDCANVLKTCLSDMPEPLLTDLFFKIITQKLSIKKTHDSKNFTELDFERIFGSKNLKIVQLILLLIPLKKRKFVQDLLTLLNKIASKENSDNKMDAKSLATLFAPHLLCPKSMTLIDLQRYITILTVELEFMIKNVKQIFKTPIELTMDIRKELERMNNTDASEHEDDGLNTVVTFCDRQAAKKTNNQTEQHIAELYAHIQSMPETPAKKKLIKQFNRQNGGLTPQVDKENSKKIQSKFKQIGDKLKNAKNLFKANSAVKSNAQVILGKRDVDKYGSQDHLNRNHQGFSNVDGYCKSDYESITSNEPQEDFLFNSKPLSPCKQTTKETPLADLTITKFCLDDEEDTSDLMMYHKKLSGNSSNEILVDYPYASESILL